jgi:hypothetical protein
MLRKFQKKVIDDKGKRVKKVSGLCEPEALGRCYEWGFIE